MPFFPQTRYYCGPASVAMALAWSGVQATPESIGPQVYTPGRAGTLRSDVVAAIRRDGRLAVRLDTLAELLGELAAGHPVLVFQNLAFWWFPQWHYAVAVGYDLDARVMLLHTGRQERRVTRLTTFERTWARGGYWAMAVLPPDTLPALEDSQAVLRAAVGLERAGRAAGATQAYEAMLGRWPGHFGAQMGLGNVWYAKGDLEGAVAAFRNATASHPDRPAAWNNLAHVLAEQGRTDEALQAATTSVRLDGDSSAYQATLEEIRAGLP